MNIGEQVTTSGMGRTSKWKFQIGTVTRILGKMIYVQWEESMVEDEMKCYEVQLFNPNVLLEFSDGVKIYTGGIYRVIEETDGKYVVGGGRLIPVQTRKEGIMVISDLKQKDREEKKKVLSLFNQKFEVSLSELVLLNAVSIENGYNRNLVEDFNSNFQETNCFELSPFMMHQYKNGELCEPHIRYMISSIGNTNSVLIGLLDLPAVTIPALLSLKTS
jgi:hypothetical protein